MEIWEITGDDLRQLLWELDDAGTDTISRARISIDGGVKVKVNEGAWTAPLGRLEKAVEENRTPERTQFLHDVMVTALEGGVGYWSVADTIVRSDNDDYFYESYVLFCSDGTKEAVDCGNGTDKPCKGHKVDIDAIARGLAIVRTGGGGINDYLTNMITTGDRENDGGDVDADGADCIAQIAAFGKVVYG